MKIGNTAFYGCFSLQSIRLPSNVTDIDKSAFDECSSLKEVVLNNGLQKIGTCAFTSCLSLERITIPSTVTLGAGVFYKCKSLREVVLNEGLQKIGGGVFNNCKSLERISFPSTVTDIGESAFYCSGLREVVCIEGLPKIEQSTFSGCSALERITFPSLSTRLDNIIQSGQVDIQNKIQQYINQSEIEWRRGGTISIPVVTRSSSGWGLVKERVGRVVSWIKYYEVKEATTLFELALWKAKIDQVEDDIYASGRDTCRVEVPGPVKDAILKYLDTAEYKYKAGHHLSSLIEPAIPVATSYRRHVKKCRRYSSIIG